MSTEFRKSQGLDGLLKEVLEILSTLHDESFLWYRGLPCASYQLIPKLMRDGMQPDKVFERERRLLTRFRQRSMAYWPAGYPQNDWEHLFAMQHFGMPTRLLDWSENLFVATHFALSDAPAHDHEGACIPVVWCIDPVEWNRATPMLSQFGTETHVLTTADDDLQAYRPETSKRRSKTPLALFGAHNSNRIVAQRGTFMIWGNEARSLESFSSDQTSRLFRIEVGGDREENRRNLRSLGFDETMVFPELPSLAAELSRTEGWKQ